MHVLNLHRFPFRKLWLVVYRTGWAEIRVTVGGRSVRVTASRPALALAVAKTLEI